MGFTIKVSEGREGEEEGEGRKKRERNKERVGGYRESRGGGGRRRAVVKDM